MDLSVAIRMDHGEVLPRIRSTVHAVDDMMGLPSRHRCDSLLTYDASSVLIEPKAD
jgi:hypothetical protein